MKQKRHLRFLLAALFSPFLSSCAPAAPVSQAASKLPAVASNSTVIRANAQVTNANAQMTATLPFVHPLFSDNMVLQRDKPLPIWGWCEPGKAVTVSMAGKSAKATGDAQGKWMVKLEPFAAGGPHTLEITGPQTVTLKNVLIGDVWLCSGQSNMWLPVKEANNGAEEAAKADFPQIRLFAVPAQASGKVLSVFKDPAQWQVANPTTVADFSAVAFFFGRHLHQNLKVPIGLIHASVGATTAEAWSSAEALETTDDGAQRIAEFAAWKDLAIEWDKYDADPALFDRLMVEWYEANDAGSAKDATWADPALKDADWKTMELPAPWWERGLPGFEGVVWFRKEFEVPEALKNKKLVLQLGSIDRRDTAWINGVEVGHSVSNGWTRQYEVPADVLKPGRNVVAVRILGTGGFSTNPQLFKLTEPGDLLTSPGLSLVGPWRYKEGVALNKAARVPSLRTGNPSIPTALYNGAIAPLVPFAIKGAIWYQGESNTNNPAQYRQVLPALIKDWRARFGVGDFPFLIVQLANFGETHAESTDTRWAELREAQADTARTIPNSGLAVTIDIGDPKDVHPKNKQDVGKRLGLAAQAIAYGQKLEYSGPAYESLKIEGNKVRLNFEHADGLAARNGEQLQGFAIAGADKKWVWADAVAEGASVVVSSAQVANPVAVRYAWDDSPTGNLTNKANLPAVPFRTDPPG